MASFDYNGPILQNPGENETPIIIYGYRPSLALGLVGTITFGILASIQLFYVFKWKGIVRTFHILLFIGALAEAGGYAARIFSHYQPFDIRGFVSSWMIIVLAPVLFTAGIDFTLNILVKCFPGSEGILLLSPKKVLAVFISTDVISIIVQAAGAALVGRAASSEYQGNSDSPLTYAQANNVLIAGLALQVGTWVIFLIFLLVAMYRAFTFESLKSPVYRRMKSMLWVILGTTLLILMRACYRLSESIYGFLTGPSTSEGLFAAFEYLPVFLAVLAWTVLPPQAFVKHGEDPVRSNRRFSDDEPKMSHVSERNTDPGI